MIRGTWDYSWSGRRWVGWEEDEQKWNDDYDAVCHSYLSFHSGWMKETRLAYRFQLTDSLRPDVLTTTSLQVTGTSGIKGWSVSDTWSKITKVRLIRYRYAGNLATVATSKGHRTLQLDVWYMQRIQRSMLPEGTGRVLACAFVIILYCTSTCTSMSCSYSVFRMERRYGFRGDMYLWYVSVHMYMYLVWRLVHTIQFNYDRFCPSAQVHNYLLPPSLDSLTFSFSPRFPESDWLMHNRQLPIGPPKTPTRPMIHDSRDPC